MPNYSTNPEWNDLPFARPRAWGSGRDGKGVRYIVVHYTAGSEGPSSAENGATYDQSRTDQTSCHYFVDSNSVVQCVETWNRSNSALHKGNRLGIQYELCGTAQTRAQWLDPVSDATLTLAARQMARDAVKYGIPVRRLSTSETRAAWYSYPNGPKGFVGHVDVTNAYPEDGGDHTDPGTQFPWDALLQRVQQFIGNPQGDVMTPDENARADAEAWRTHCLINDLEAVASGPTVGEPNVAKAQRVAMEQRINQAVAAVAADVEELKNRPAVEAAPIDVASFVAALQDPAVTAVLVEAARQGANAAEDS